MRRVVVVVVVAVAVVVVGGSGSGSGNKLRRFVSVFCFLCSVACCLLSSGWQVGDCLVGAGEWHFSHESR